MAITVNGNILRNLPEQVSKNTEDILDLQDADNALDGRVTDLENSIISNITLNNLNVTGNTVIGNDGSDTLTVTGASAFAGNVGITGNVTASGSLAAASASFTGNETIGGNLTVNGNIVNTLLNNTENVLNGSSYVADYYANEGDIEISNLPTNVECSYAHWRISNGKLSVVIQLYVPSYVSISSAASVQIGEFDIPQWAFNRLNSIPGVTTILTKTQVFEMYSTANLSDNYHIRFVKYGVNTLQIYGTCFGTSTTFPEVASARFEFNFIL